MRLYKLYLITVAWYFYTWGHHKFIDFNTCSISHLNWKYFLLQFYCNHWLNKICFIFLVLLLFFHDLVVEVQHVLYLTVSKFKGNVEYESDLEYLIEQQFETLQKPLKIYTSQSFWSSFNDIKKVSHSF